MHMFIIYGVVDTLGTVLSPTAFSLFYKCFILLYFVFYSFTDDSNKPRCVAHIMTIEASPNIYIYRCNRNAPHNRK